MCVHVGFVGHVDAIGPAFYHPGRPESTEGASPPGLFTVSRYQVW